MNKKTTVDTLETDVLIVGAGMAGYAAAIGASEAGRRVTLIEQHADPGGAATLSNVGTLCGLYYRGQEPVPVPHPLCTALTAKLFRTYPQTKILSLPEGLQVVAYEKSALNAVLKEDLLQHGVNMVFGAHVTAAEADTQKITAVTFAKNDYRYTVRSHSFVDCTGNGFLAQHTGHPMLRSNLYQAAAQVIRFEHVKPTTEYALNISLRKIMIETQAHHQWPPAYLKLSVVPGSLRNDCFDLKLPLAEPVTDDSALPDRLQQEVAHNLPKLIQALRQIGSLTNATVLEIAQDPGIRLQQRPQGQYILSHNDVAGCTKPHDGIALGTWPIEAWDYNGKVTLEYFAAGDGFLIPARSLTSPQFENLYFAGKGLSADDKAIASARVTGTCLQTGYAAGKLAAYTDPAARQEIIHKLYNTLTRKP